MKFIIKLAERSFLLVMLYSLVLYSQDKKNVAVFNFEPRGVSSIESQSVTDRIRLELSRTGNYSVIEREMMDKILKEQEFQLTGMCSESSCLVQLGEFLAVHYMIGGSVTKIGRLFTIEARLIDIGTGEVVTSVIEDYSGPIENLLLKTTKVVVAKILGVDELSGGMALLGSSDLQITSNPSGALIYLNDRPIGENTPYTIEGLQEGEYRVKLTKGQLSAEDIIILQKDEISSLRLILEKEKFMIRVYSDPPGADVYLDKENIGITPITYAITDTAKTYRIQVYKENGFSAINEEINGASFGKSKLLRLNYSLKLGGSLILSNYNKEKVLIDGLALDNYFNKKLKNGVEINGLELRGYSIVMSKVFFESKQENINLTKQERMITLSAQLKRKTGKVKFYGGLTEFSGKINGDWKQIDFTSGLEKNTELLLPYGDYKLKANSKGYFPFKTSFSVCSPENETITLAFKAPQKSKARVRAAIFPGVGHYYSMQSVKGLIYSSLWTSSLALVAYSASAYDKELTNYNIFRDQYMSVTNIDDLVLYRSQVDDSRDKLTAYQTQFLAGVSGAVATYLISLIDIQFFFPKLEHSLTMDYQPKKNQQEMNVCWLMNF